MSINRRRFAAIASLAMAIAGCSATPGSTSIPGPSATGGTLPVTATAAGTSVPAATPASTTSPVASAVGLGNRLLATIDVDAEPCALAFDGKAAWITSYGAGVVDRVDLATNAVTDRVKTGGTPCGVAVGPDGRLWVADLAGQQVLAIDRATMRISGRIGQLSASLWDLKAGFGSIWVVDRLHQVLLRIDPSATEVLQRIPIGPSGGGLAVTKDAVWVADTIDGTIRRIDPSSNSATVTATLAGGATWFADDGASHIAVSVGRGGVAVLDPASGSVASTVNGWIAPRDGTVAGTTAWVPDGRGRAVRLLDLVSGEVAGAYDLPGGKNPFVAEVVLGDIFVLDFGGSTVWRIQP